MAIATEPIIIIDTINILMATNIPDQPDISLTSRVIVGTSLNSKKYNEYPYITKSVELDIAFNSYNEILDFFFIKEVFSKNVKIINMPPAENVKTYAEWITENPKYKGKSNARKQYDEYLSIYNSNRDKEDTKILNYNIEKMLQLLLITYPIAGNIYSTIKDGYITNSYPSTKYSYLNINSKTYTISKTIWINDKYNHYLSKQLVKDYKEFDAWKAGETRNINTSISDNEKNLQKIIDDIKKKNSAVFDNDINKVSTYLTNRSNWVDKIESLSTTTIREAMGILYAHLIILRWELYRTTKVNSANEYNGMQRHMIEAYKTFITQDADVPNTPLNSSTEKRYINIINLLKSSYNSGIGYNLQHSHQFMIELNRTLKIVINSNLVSISSTVQDIIKDLYENNEKSIVLDNNLRYIEEPDIILGNDKYNNANFKTLSNAFVKDIEMVKKNINIIIADFEYNTIEKFIDSIQNPKKITIGDAFGLIYDNNNVTKPKYEIYTYIDLTDGKITDENQDNLDLCTFRDELLFIKFTQLINNNIIIQHDPLIQLLPNKIPKQNITENPNPKPKPQQGGATTKKVYYILKNNNTRKNNV
jgi:hypothetical protein